ncbi:MAG TPA: hypothetical protein VEK11_12525 [Thermoanaerobaculia bacterium]|jgi:hypothetical protein|nr:hypothetical protein [Thermoanaerobaculia bacterium]
MTRHEGRITLIAREANKPDTDWNYIRCRSRRIAFLDSVASLKFALAAAVTDVGLDIERIIVDRAGSADEFLDLLATAPADFLGDVVMIRDDGGGFLSATARGGDRVLYALTYHDLRFYLETHDLVTGRAALELTA